MKASVGYLRVLGERGLFLPPLRAAPTGFNCVPQHKKDALHVSVSGFMLVDSKHVLVQETLL